MWMFGERRGSGVRGQIRRRALWSLIAAAIIGAAAPFVARDGIGGAIYTPN